MWTRRKLSVMLGTVSLILLMVAVFELTGAAAEDVLLTGTITSASGEKMEGVTVSARQVGKTFTTSVFTDAQGEYYFPRLESGPYKVWAQASGYDAMIWENLTLRPGVNRQNVALKTLPNLAIEQMLHGDEWLASLPAATDEDKKMKEVLRLNC